jgi:asparagine synthetase B (glutamine-hydrolysing)
MKFRTDIVPSIHQRTGVKDSLDLEAICAFAAVGYFMTDSTYYKGCKALPPASVVTTDEKGRIVDVEPYFEWHYSPKDISLSQAVEQFAELFEGILSENKDGQWTIPISGGLDSRTLVAAAHRLGRQFKGYSYAFDSGIDETVYGRRMSELLDFPFDSFTIGKGVLWNYLEKLARANECYSEFTNPRQFAVYDRLKAMGGTFILGHMGDLIFDDMHVPEGISADSLFDIHWKRTIKPGGFKLGERLWKDWNLNGSFGEYLRDSMKSTFDRIDIRESNPKLRAFKSWTHVRRWTSTNLQLFTEFGPNLIPYLDNRMIEFVCAMPEKWLAGRRIQIEYLKKYAPGLARIPWQSHEPFNLYNYPLDKTPVNIPFKVLRKARQLMKGGRKTHRNWEIQFLGPENDARLREMLFGDPGFAEWIPSETTLHFLKAFGERQTPNEYHPVSMLLTLSAFDRYLR